MDDATWIVQRPGRPLSQRRVSLWGGAMGGSLYSDARLYDLMFPQPSAPGSRAHFYLDLAAATGGPVLELGCATASLLLPIAERGIPCQGLEVSSEMLAQARAKFVPVGCTRICTWAT
jgi:SAM-dependent methyltransferase